MKSETQNQMDEKMQCHAGLKMEVEEQHGEASSLCREINKMFRSPAEYSDAVSTVRFVAPSHPSTFPAHVTIAVGFNEAQPTGITH